MVLGLFMNNNVPMLTIASLLCVITYILSVRTNPGAGTLLILLILFLANYIYTYISWKHCKRFSLLVKVISFVVILIYSILFIDIIVKLFPISILEYVSKYDINIVRLYLFAQDMLKMFINMIVLLPLLFFIYDHSYKLIAALLSSVVILYPLVFSDSVNLYGAIAIILANSSGSILAIYYTRHILERKESRCHTSDG